MKEDKNKNLTDDEIFAKAEKERHSARIWAVTALVMSIISLAVKIIRGF